MAYPPVPEALGDQAQGESSSSGLDDSDSDEAAAISCDQLRRSETTWVHLALVTTYHWDIIDMSQLPMSFHEISV